MTELAGGELAERDMEGAAQEADFADLARFQCPAQSDERRMMNHVLIHSEEDPLFRGSLDENPRLFAAAGKRFFNKDGDSCLDQGRCHDVVQGRRYQNMCGIKAAFAQRDFDRVEYVLDLVSTGEAERRRLIRIDDCGKLQSWQGLQNFGMGAGNETGADETDARHCFVLFTSAASMARIHGLPIS